MTKSTFDDGVLSHPKMVEAGEDATDLWMRSVIYCNKYGLGGVIRTGAVRGFTSKPQRVVDQLIERLVSARLWDVEPGVGWRVHDFHDWNWTEEQRAERREEIARKRSDAGRKGNEARWGGRSQTIANGSQTDRNEESQVRVANSQEHRPPPAPAPSPSPGEGKHPPTPASGGVPTGRKPRAAKLPAQPELPDSRRPSIDAALSAVEDASAGRFVVPRGAAFDDKLLRPLQVLIDGFPDLADWSRVGRWLASWERVDAILSAAWLTKNRDAFAKAEAWERNTGDPQRSGVRALDDDSNGDPAWLIAAQAKYRRDNPLPTGTEGAR